jgi:hypothetical protein
MIKRLVACVCLILAISTFGACSVVTGQTSTAPPTSMPTYIPPTVLPTTPTVIPSQLALTTMMISNSIDGLAFSLSVNSTSLQSGQGITVIVDEQNTLAKVNNVPAADNWSIEGLSLGP